jgi:hypothetical protein
MTELHSHFICIRSLSLVIKSKTVYNQKNGGVMTKKLTGIFLVVALVTLLLPASAIARAPGEFHLNVRNQTGGVVHLSLTDANGIVAFYTLDLGVFPVNLTEGVYSYWASTLCGNVAGSWNVNVSKTLFLSCKGDSPFLSLAKTFTPDCDDFGYMYRDGPGAPYIFVSQTHYGEHIGDFWEGSVPSYEISKNEIEHVYGLPITEG